MLMWLNLIRYFIHIFKNWTKNVHQPFCLHTKLYMLANSYFVMSCLILCRRRTPGCLFWITCKRLKLLRKASHLQVIQNSAPSVVRRRQCDIQNYEDGMILKFSLLDLATCNKLRNNNLESRQNTRVELGCV
jgi:hypothetical protein